MEVLLMGAAVGLYGNLIWEENEASEITSNDVFQKLLICQQVQNVL